MRKVEKGMERFEEWLKKGLKISYRFLGFNRALQDNNLLSRLVCEDCRGTTWGLSLQAEEEGGL